MHHPASLARIIPFLLVTIGSFCVTTVVLRTAAQYTYQPLVFEVGSPEVLTDTDLVHVRDERTLIQTFTVPESTLMTHISIRLADTEKALPFRLLVSLYEEERPLAQADVRSADIGVQGRITAPLFSHLSDDKIYTLAIEPHGVERGADIGIAKEADETVLPSGALVMKHENGQVDIRGHMSFQILRRATPQTLVWSLGHSGAGHTVVGLLVGAILVCVFWRRLRPIATHQLRPLKDTLQTTPPRRQELLTSGIALLILAIGVSWPLYRNTDYVSTLGDVNRALVYKAVARQELFRAGELALWEPYLCGGGPLLANPESDHTSLFFIPVVLFGPEYGLRVAITLSLWLSSMGVYAIARRYLSLRIVPSFLASVVFTYSGFQMLAFGDGYLAWLSLGLLPWLIAAFLESLAKPGRLTLLVGVLMLLLLGSSLHITTYGLIALFILAGVYAITYRRWQPLLLVGIALLASLLLAAPKLLPMLELQTLISDFERGPAYIPPISWFPRMFLDRSQDLYQEFKDTATDINYRWTDYGAYIGILPLILAAGTLIRWRRNQVLIHALWILAAASILITFSPPPLRFIQDMPVVGEILRNPQRLRVLFVLCVSLLAAVGLQRAINIVRGKWIAATFAAVVSLFVTVDLLSYHAPLMGNIFPLPRPVATTHQPSFTRFRSSYTNDAGFYRAGYISYLSNASSTDLCPAYLDNEQVPARGIDASDPSRPYMGEAFLASGSGTAAIQKLTANKIVVDISAQSLDTLVLNQTFFPGWKVSSDRESTSHQGLLAVLVEPSEEQVVFQYRPLSYQLGSIYAVATALALGFWRFSPRSIFSYPQNKDSSKSQQGHY